MGRAAERTLGGHHGFCELGAFGRTRRAGWRLLWSIGLRRGGVLCAPEAYPAPYRGLGPCRRGRHNVTPREDYRTAVLSDSPDTGCSLSAPAAGAIAGTARAARPPAAFRRASAGRSWPFPPPSIPTTIRCSSSLRTRTRARRPLGRWARGTIDRRSKLLPNGSPALCGK